jgi:hypothetical protein
MAKITYKRRQPRGGGDQQQNTMIRKRWKDLLEGDNEKDPHGHEPSIA